MAISLPPVHLLTSQAELTDLVSHLQTSTRLALDTESNSMFAYRAQVCLVQLSSEEGDFLIDPLSIDDLSPLNVLTSNPAIEKIVHGAEYDVLALKKEYHLEFTHIFDTALAARILGTEKHGLNNLTQLYFGVKLDKHWQRADWGKRPMSQEQIEYARLDTRYLLPLRDALHQELVEHGCWEEAQELFTELDALMPPPDEDPFLAMAGAHRLRPKPQARLRELHHWREGLAQAQNIPASKVLTNELLLKIARHNPSNLKELAQVLGKSGRWLRVNGGDILAALARAGDYPVHKTKLPHSDRNIQARHHLLKQWRKHRAQVRGVTSDIILPNDLMWEIATRPPQTLADLGSYLGPWRLDHYGEDILRILTEGSFPA